MGKTKKNKLQIGGTKKATVKKEKKEKKEVKEFEAKFLDIDIESLYKKLKVLGGVKKQENTIFRRSVYNLCDIKRGYVRVRDEGNKVTMTAKIYKDPKFPDEYEVEIKDNFEKGRDFLENLNLKEKAYHETMRETWRVPFGKKKELCEIAIDRIPGLPLYIEVECKTEKDLNKSIKLLEMDKSKIGYGAYGKVFDVYYGISQIIMDNDVPSLTFNNIKNELKPFIKKGVDVLDKVYKEHLEVYRELKSKK
jgi:adenylate cyclase class 2